MDIDRGKALKLALVILATLAALAVMSTVVQLIQVALPFLIVGAGIYFAYRWVLSDDEPPTAEDVEQQARGWFDRFRRGKKTLETAVEVGAALNEMGEQGQKARKQKDTVVEGTASKAAPPAEETEAEPPSRRRARRRGRRTAKANQMKETLASNPKGGIEFKDRDVVISAEDLAMPDISRLEEKEKEVPQVDNSVMAQIEERRRRLNDEG